MPTWMFWVLVALGALIAGRYVFNFWQLAKLTTSASRAGYLIVVGCVAVVIVLVVAIMLVYGGGPLAGLFMVPVGCRRRAGVPPGDAAAERSFLKRNRVRLRRA